MGREKVRKIVMPHHHAPTQVLEVVGHIRLPGVAKRKLPCECFKARHELYVWPRFEKCIGPVLRPVDRVPESSLTIFRLLHDAMDSVILHELSRYNLTQWYQLSAFIEERMWWEEASNLLCEHPKNFFLRGIHGKIYRAYLRGHRGSPLQMLGAVALNEFGKMPARQLILSPSL